MKKVTPGKKQPIWQETNSPFSLPHQHLHILHRNHAPQADILILDDKEMFTSLQNLLPDVVDRLLVERENRAGKVG